MKLKKVIALLLTVAVAFSLCQTVFADASKSWNAGPGTPTVDGQKDDVYAGAQEMKLEAVTDGDGDGTVASAWAVWDGEAVYFFVEVADSQLNDANSNVWEKDSVELRWDNNQLIQTFAVDGSVTGTDAANAVTVQTDKGYNTEIKVPYDTAAGSMKFSIQVNAATDGARKATYHTSEDLKDAWQNTSVYETLVFSAEAAAATEAPKTGVVSLGVIFGIGAVLSGCGAFIKGKKEK